MRPDGKVAVMIGERIDAVGAENAAAMGLAGQPILVSSGGFFQ